MEKDLNYIELFDIYGKLLTLKQQEIFKSYYIYDLSFSEIAEPENRTRQSVHEIIKKTCNKLLEYENILNIKTKTDKLKKLATNTCDKNISDSIFEIVGK